MITERDIDIIDKYLWGGLSETEKNEVEDKLLNDQEFAETVGFMKNLRTASVEAGRAELRLKIRSIIKENKRAAVGFSSDQYQKSFITFKIRNQVFHLRRVYLYAAAFLILFVPISIIILLSEKRSLPNEKVTERITDTIRSHSDKIHNILSEVNMEKGITITPLLLKSNQFGYVGETVPKSQSFLIKTFRDKEFTNHYLLSSNSIILLGDYNLKNIKKLYQAPLFLVLNYSGIFYHIKRVEGEVRMLEIERDSLVIRECSK